MSRISKKQRVTATFLVLFLAFALLPITAFAAGNVEINETNFPDANFRNYVNDNIPHANPAYITQAEAEAINVIDVSNLSITSLTGIEFFTNLQILYATSNQLTTLDFSQNTALMFLDLSNNQLTTLDLSQNTTLTFLNLSNNLIAMIDLSHNTALNDLRVSNNQLTTLDLSHNMTLTHLDVRNNGLAALDLSHNTALSTLIYSQQNNTALRRFSASQYYVDMNGVVGSANLAKVSVSDGNWSYNQATGILTFTGSGIPRSVSYTYDTGILLGGTPVTMPVLISLVAIPHTVTVTGGAVAGGSSTFTEGAAVNITADTAPAGKVFDKWASASSGVTFADAGAESTSFHMPNNDVTVTATYKNPLPASIDPAIGKQDSEETALPASIGLTAANFDQKAPGDITVAKSDGDYTLTAINNGAYTLISGSDYVDNGGSIVISREYLETLPAGTYELTFDYDGGADPVLTLTVTATNEQLAPPQTGDASNTAPWISLMLVLPAALLTAVLKRKKS